MGILEYTTKKLEQIKIKKQKREVKDLPETVDAFRTLVIKDYDKDGYYGNELILVQPESKTNNLNIQILTGTHAGYSISNIKPKKINKDTYIVKFEIGDHHYLSNECSKKNLENLIDNSSNNQEIHNIEDLQKTFRKLNHEEELNPEQ